jgi:CRISPR-associated protein Cas1
MKSLILDKDDTTVVVKNSRIYFQEHSIALALIDTVVVASDVTLCSKTLLSLTKANVALLYIDKQSKNFAMTLPQYAKNSELKLAQYEARMHGIDIARFFVEQKIYRHLKHIGFAAYEAWHTQLQQAESISALMGYEGAFASLYFEHYFATLPAYLHKGKRTKQPPQDPVNAVLSFIYTMVYHHMTAKLYKNGFEPSIGYLHTPFRAHQALASDMTELYRAMVNKHVAQWFIDKKLISKDFTRNNGVYMRYEARKKIWGDIQKLLYTIDKQATKDLVTLKKMIRPHQEQAA